MRNVVWWPSCSQKDGHIVTFFKSLLETQFINRPPPPFNFSCVFFCCDCWQLVGFFKFSLQCFLCLSFFPPILFYFISGLLFDFLFEFIIVLLLVCQSTMWTVFVGAICINNVTGYIHKQSFQHFICFKWTYQYSYYCNVDVALVQ